MMRHRVFIKMALLSDLSSMRLNYNVVSSLNIDKLPVKEPIGLFKIWFNEAIKLKNDGFEPNAMTLATSTRNGFPSARIVLLKGINYNGFEFFTNFESRKGQELNANPNAALVFYWPPLHKQIRIEGKVEQLTEDESSTYFHSRPYGSQISACVSMKQSSVIPDRQILIDREKKLKEQFPETEEIPKPKYWGGYRVIPSSIEFWHGQSNRLHDRLVFQRKEDVLKKENNENISLWNDGDDGWMFANLSP